MNSMPSTLMIPSPSFPSGQSPWKAVQATALIFLSLGEEEYAVRARLSPTSTPEALGDASLLGAYST